MSASYIHPARSSDLLRAASQAPRMLSLGDAIIDGALRGGIGTNMITELSGEAGAGKTQFCLTMALRAQLPASCGGLGGRVFYLNCLEGEFPAKRLENLAVTQVKRLEGVDTGGEQYTARRFLDNVITHMCPNTDELVDVLSNSVGPLVDKENVRLIIIDSIAAVVRPEFEVSNRTQGKDETIARYKVMFEVHRALTKLCRRTGVAVVVVNQVSGKVNDDSCHVPMPGDETQQWHNGVVVTKREAGLLPGNANSLQPSLGLSWSQLVSERLLLVRETSHMRGLGVGVDDNGQEGEGAETRGAGSKRAFVLEYSPRKPSVVCHYDITAEGLRGVGVLPPQD
jgi:RecA/RadA recombinase